MFRQFLLGLALQVMFLGMASAQDAMDPIVTENYNKSDVTSDSTTTVRSPPPSAIAPSINSANSDLCTVGVSGAVQTQILGISAGKTVRDMNCEKLKNAKTLYDMCMKVALKVHEINMKLHIFEARSQETVRKLCKKY